MSGELHEKCAVVAVSLEAGAELAPYIASEALFALQHRGTEASGIAGVKSDGSPYSVRGDGMVKDVYTPEALQTMTGTTAIGHNRYATSGPKHDQPQPIIDRDIRFAFGHNGNLPQTDQLSTFLSKLNVWTENRIDSEMAALAIAHYIRNGQDLPDAVELAYPLFRGAATCVASQGDTVVAFKDKRGIRPGVIGELDEGYIVASETCALDIVDAQYVRDLKAGEMVVLNGKTIESRQLATTEEKFDIFEIVYFMRPDSRLAGESVYEMRYRSGKELARQHLPYSDNAENTIVVPIPDTSIPAAEGYAEALDLRTRTAIVKNRYIGRTFMQATNEARRHQLRRKHNFIQEQIDGKDIVLIDDSIVRLNTAPDIVDLAHSLGAKSVTMLVASPPIRFPDFYGIDTPSQSELAAANLTIEQMREKIGAEYLGFLSLSGLIRSTGLPPESFNLSSFTGEYPIGIGKRKNEITTPISMEGIE